MDPDDMRGSSFPATRHSAIERIRAGNADARREAFGDLIEGYWKPVYKHLRLTWRLDAEDARFAFAREQHRSICWSAVRHVLPDNDAPM